jgi:hypothetical protein
MSSTVTTTTISAVTTAATFEGLGQTMTMVAILLLIVALLAREISSAAKGAVGRRVARGLDIALVPLTVAFGIVVWINSGSFLS